MRISFDFLSKAVTGTLMNKESCNGFQYSGMATWIVSIVISNSYNIAILLHIHIIQGKARTIQWDNRCFFIFIYGKTPT